MPFVMCLVVKQNAGFVTEFVHITSLKMKLFRRTDSAVSACFIFCLKVPGICLSEKSFIIRYVLELKCNNTAHSSHQYSTHIYVEYKV
jgi:hypothetical protein